MYICDTMKRILIVLFVLAILPQISFSQKRFAPAIRLGLAATQVDGDTYAGYNKVGPVIGATLMGKINAKWSAQFEIDYIQKGSRHNADIDKGDYSFYLMRLNYIEVPLLFQYHQKKFRFDMGPSLAYLFGAREFDYSGEVQNQFDFKPTDLCANIGFSYTLINNLSVNWRFSYSLLPIRQFPTYSGLWYDRNVQKNNLFVFSLTYQFNKKKADEKK